MKLNKISMIVGKIRLLTGLHIGSGNTEMHIGGTDNTVIKDPITHRPYIPGSSLKGKMRSMLEWHAGLVGDTKGNVLNFSHLERLQDEPKQTRARNILKLFGVAPEGVDKIDSVKTIGPSRLSFWDCFLTKDWIKKIDGRHMLLTETKMENTIDRIHGTANPRSTERVIAGSEFDFKLSMRVHDDDNGLIEELLKGLKLLEMTGLGGSGSRGYGKIEFSDLKSDDKDWMEKLRELTLSEDNNCTN